MKIRLRHLAVIALTSLVIPNWAIGADTTPPDKATPGTPAETDTKSQENNPAGPAAQTTAHPKEGTKKKKHKTGAPAPQGDQNEQPASKDVQKENPTAPAPNDTPATTK